jgi:hypothetical protein
MGVVVVGFLVGELRYAPATTLFQPLSQDLLTHQPDLWLAAMGDHPKQIQPPAVRVRQLRRLRPQPLLNSFQGLLRYSVIPIRRHQQPAQAMMGTTVVVMLHPAAYASGRICCVPGTAHVLKGEPIITTRAMLGKSQTQPDGGEGYSAIATGIR